MTESEWFVLLLGCKATLILGIVAALTLLAGRRWPQGCALWRRLGVLALLVLPVAAWTLPPLGIPVLSGPPPAIVAAPLLPWQRGASLATTGDSEQPGRQDLQASQPDASFAARSTPAAPVAAVTAIHRRLPASIPALCFAAVYSFVVVALAIRFIRAGQGLGQLKRASSLVDDSNWRATLAHWSAVLQVDRPVELRVSDNVSIPMTFGWRDPVILIPSDCVTTCDQIQRDAIVIHELTHIAHGDFFWHALSRLTASLYWLHPLMWLIRRQDGALCERICDALCSRHLSRESYAQALVRIAGRKVLRPAASLGMAMAHPSSLGRRLHDLEACEPAQYSPPNRVQRLWLGATAGLVLGLIVVGTLTTRIAALEEKDAAAAKKTNAQKDSTKTDSIASVRLPGNIEGEVLDQQDKPVAKANVVISIVSNPDRAPALPKPWTATTDQRGRYTFSTDGLTLTADDFFCIKIQAEGFAELTTYYQGEAGAKGSLPGQRLHAARKIQGRLVDPEGKPVADAVVRFQASSADMTLLFDTGPLPVDQSGAFTASIPKAGKAAFAIYPRGFAPRIVDVPEDAADLGPIHVETGTSLTGRVVDRQGHGVAGTVVAIQSEEHRMLFSFGVLIGTAVKTDETGNFTLPPVRGTYKVWVAGDAPDYSRRITVNGSTPPPILPEKIEFDGSDATEKIEFREAVSIVVRGSVRRADGSPVPGVEVKSSALPVGWRSGVDLPSARTDGEGRYALKLPAPICGVRICVFQSIRMPDGSFQRPKAVGSGADALDQKQSIKFDLLDADVEDADWEVGSEE
jgi:beta-lactamase regulating signal transducer with metallopeptidase domain